MEKLLPYYERELSLLRANLREWAQRFPERAARLGVSGNEGASPAVERLTQGTALLCARLARKLEYGTDRFTTDLLGIQAPFYLRPIPSCSIMQVEGRLGPLPKVIPRGTELRTRGTSVCAFRTVYDVFPAPLTLTVGFTRGTDAPASLGLPSGVGCGIAITIAWSHPVGSLEDAAATPLRVFIDAEGAAGTALYDAILSSALCTCVEAEGQWCKLPALPFAPVGLSTAEAMLPTPWRQEDSLRLLAEYFACPDKFLFLDIDLKSVLAGCPHVARRATVHVLLPDMHRTTAAQSLHALSPTVLRPGCTPIINLFTRAAAPIRLRKRRDRYPVVLPRMAEAKSTLYDIDSMKLMHTADGKNATFDMAWFYGPKDGRLHCWMFELADPTYGTEDTVSFVDTVQMPLGLHEGSVDVHVTCTNGELPCVLPIGRPDGDLTSDQDMAGSTMRLLRKPSTPLQLVDKPGGHWQAITVGHANHRNDTQFDLAALHSLLRMHARPGSAVAERQLSGIVGVSRREIQHWVKFKIGSALTYGYEVTLTIDEVAFTECSVAVFARVMERVLSYYLTYPHFLCLNVVDKGGRILIRGGLQHGPQSPA